MSIYKKLLEVQKEVGAISKDSINPHFKNQYFDINSVLEEVKPILSDKGLFLSQPLLDNKVYTIITDVESGEQIESWLPLPEGERNPQKIGSCLTYYRRYNLISLLGLQGEQDDDATLATEPQQPQQPQKAKPKPKAKITPEAYQKAVEAVQSGKVTLQQIKDKYELSRDQEKALKELAKL